MKKILPFAFIAVLLGFLLVAFQFYTGPQKAAQNIITAIEENDKDKLSKAIDFPVLRENIKSQIRTELLAEVEGDLEMAGMMLGMEFAEIFVNQAITPEGVLAIVDSYELKREVEENSIKIEFLSLKEARLTVADEELLNEGEVGVIFERRGLNWVMVNFEFPDS